MTGFGDATEQADGLQFAVEVRSLNNRYFKSTIRLPEEIAGLEAEVETRLRNKLNRGSITLTVRMAAAEKGSAQKINQAVVEDYLRQLDAVRARAGRPAGVEINLAELLALPGVLLAVDQTELLHKARPVVLRLTDQACAKLIAMRVTEGKAITEDLNRQRSFILDRVRGIAERAPQVVEEYHLRLRDRIDELLRRAELKMDEKDLIREVAIFAERSDVAEEVSRLSGHFEQFDQILSSPDGEPAGRTLDFLTQELLREANTIASKSNDSWISRAIVEIKGAIDRIKEQVQNVE